MLYTPYSDTCSTDQVQKSGVRMTSDHFLSLQLGSGWFTNGWWQISAALCFPCLSHWVVFPLLLCPKRREEQSRSYGEGNGCLSDASFCHLSFVHFTRRLSVHFAARKLYSQRSLCTYIYHGIYLVAHETHSEWKCDHFSLTLLQIISFSDQKLYGIGLRLLCQKNSTVFF